MSVIVVSYNTRDLLRGCLRSLAPQVQAADGEIIVVDNGSADGSADMVRAEFPDVRLLRLGENRGFGAANNQAAALSEAEYLLLLNSDTIMHPGALAVLLAMARAHPDAGAVGPRLLNGDSSLQPSCWRFPTPGRVAAETFGLLRLIGRPTNYRRVEYDKVMRVDFAIGACLLVRRALFAQLGGFDEAFFMYAEETDLCRRMRDRGHRVYYTPAATVTHLGGGSQVSSGAQRILFQRGQDRYFRKHFGRTGFVRYRAASVVRCAVRLVVWRIAGMVRRELRPGLAPRLSTHCWMLRWHLGQRS